jgi:CubicO group peptidase (beta-lactamase class C family)
MRYLSLLLASVLLLYSCKKDPLTNPPVTETIYFPPTGTTEWATVAPESLGWKTVNLQALYDYLQQQDTRAFLVLKNGKIVLEQYFGQNVQGTAAFNQNSLWYWASASKTLTSFIVGKAQQEGFLNISNKTSQYLGAGWTSEPLAKENLITVRHQLTMTSGLDDDGGNADDTSSSALVYKADAGTRWAYHNAPYILLQTVVINATGQSFTNYFDAKLKSKIGMDGQWIPNGYENIYWSTARSMARFGILIQAKAKWDGVDVLGDSAYLNTAINTSQNINLSYGYLWWLNGKTSYMAPQSQIIFPGYVTSSAPADMFAAMGKNGQLINIISSKGLVVVRMGNTVNTGLVSIDLQEGIWQKLNAVMN